MTDDARLTDEELRDIIDLGEGLSAEFGVASGQVYVILRADDHPYDYTGHPAIVGLTNNELAALLLALRERGFRE